MDRDTLVCVPDFDDEIGTEVDPRRAWLMAAAERPKPLPPPPPGNPRRVAPCPRTPLYVREERVEPIAAAWTAAAEGTPAPVRVSELAPAHRGQISVVLGCRGGAGA